MSKWTDLPDFEGTDWSSVLEADQMIIWRSALVGLEEQVEHLLHRAKYYDEYPTASQFTDAMNDLAARIRQIRKTSQGEAK